MPILKEKPKANLPPCKGCDTCGDYRPLDDVLYMLGYDNKWYCNACFMKIAVRWPKAQGPKPQVVVFTEGQKAEAVDRGTQRRQAHAGKGHTDYQVSRKDKLQMDIEGAYGEVAARLFFEKHGLAVEMPDIDLGGKGDGGKDLVVAGVVVAVKTVSEGRNLLEPKKQPFSKDQAVVLVWSDFDKENKIVGWTTGGIFHQMALAPLSTMDPGTVWMRWQNLRDPMELVERFRRRVYGQAGIQEVHSDDLVQD